MRASSMGKSASLMERTVSAPERTKAQAFSMLWGFFPVKWKVSVRTASVVSRGMRTDFSAARQAECQMSPVSRMARMAPVSISPASEPAPKSIGLLEVLLINDLSDQFTGALRACWVSATDCADRRHDTLADGGLLSLVIGVAIAALGEPVGGDAVEQGG